MEQLKIFIVDEQPVVKEGLESFLEEYADLVIAGFAANIQDAMESLRQLNPDVILMDLALPDMSGKEAIRLLCEEYPDAAVIIYTDRKDEAFVYQALKAGAHGYLLKSSPLQDVVNAIRRVNMDEYILSPDLSPAIIDFYLEHRDLGNDRLGDYQQLSEREKQVFRLLANGEETQEVAELLCISPKTVAKHRSSIKRKLDLKTPVEMTQYAMRIGILKQEDFDKSPDQIL
ncbi:MAG: response regulator [Desulfuromonadales bacterium]